METEVMLTTFDNPYDPFDEFIPWFLFDIEQGYYTCSRLARIARSSSEFSTVEEKKETERAIDEIIDHDFLNIYKKVTRNVNENVNEDAGSVDNEPEGLVEVEVPDIQEDAEVH